jgi:hypothetical protein
MEGKNLPAVKFPSLPELAEEFSDLFQAIFDVEGLEPEQQLQGILPAVEALARRLTSDSDDITRSQVDRLCELLQAIEWEEKRIRQIAQQAEQRARHYAHLSRLIRDSLQTAMQELGIQRIEGIAHRLALYKSPKRLFIANESIIPDKYFDIVVRETRELNKDRLLADLEAGIEVPGAWLETDRRRLDVK